MPDVKTDKRFVPYMVAEQPSLVAIKQAKILLNYTDTGFLKMQQIISKKSKFQSDICCIISKYASYIQRTFMGVFNK